MGHNTFVTSNTGLTKYVVGLLQGWSLKMGTVVDACTLTYYMTADKLIEIEPIQCT